MTSETTNPASQPVNSEQGVGASISSLRALLAMPQSGRPKEWQEAVARHVRTLSADFAAQDDPVVALRELALVALAARKGSSDAKKRSLRPTRWLAQKPPSIAATVDSLEEARSAVRVLQPIKADWVSAYIQEELARSKWPGLAGDLLGWQLKLAGSLEALLSAISDESYPQGDQAAAWIAGAALASVKVIAKSNIDAGAGFMSEIDRLAVRAAAVVGRTSSSAKEMRSAQRSIVALLTQTAAIEPTILLQGAAVAALSSIARLAKDPDPIAGSELDIACRRLLALLRALLPNAPQEAVSHYRRIWTAMRECAPRADKIFSRLVKQNPALQMLERAEEAIVPGARSDSGLERVVVEFIANWDDYCVGNRDNPAIEQMGKRIEALLTLLGFARFGAVGDALPFDPLRHSLTESKGVPPTRVRIRKSGILFERNDGSSRVLVPAIVAPI